MEPLKCIILWVLVISNLSIVCLGSKDAAFDERVRAQCGFTRYPTLCVQTLGGLGSGVDLLSVLVNTTMSQTNLPHSNFEVLSSHFISPQAQQARIAIGKRADPFIFIIIY